MLFSSDVSQELAQTQSQRLSAAAQDLQGTILRLESFVFVPEPFCGWSQVTGFFFLEFMDETRQISLLSCCQFTVPLPLAQLLKARTLLFIPRSPQPLCALMALAIPQRHVATPTIP